MSTTTSITQESEPKIVNNTGTYLIISWIIFSVALLLLFISMYKHFIKLKTNSFIYATVSGILFICSFALSTSNNSKKENKKENTIEKKSNITQFYIIFILSIVIFFIAVFVAVKSIKLYNKTYKLTLLNKIPIE